MANIPIVQFNGGEFSPKIEARADTERYRAGCRKLENLIPLVQGPAERRQGTHFIYRSEEPS